MKKAICGAVAAFALAVAAFFGVYAGSPFIQLLSGPVPLTGSFEEAKGAYVEYQAVWPVASYGAEYYSGDPDRVSKWGYVLYDEEREEFLNVVVSDRMNSSFRSLMRSANQADDSNPSKVTPITVKGTLLPMEDFQIDKVLSALVNGDSKSTRQMDEKAFAQESWYTVELGRIQGLGAGNIWLMVVTAVLNGVIFMVAFPGLFKREKTEGEADVLSEEFAGSGMDQLMALQRVWLEPWNRKMGNKNINTSVFCVLFGIAVPVGIGLAVKISLPGILALHLPLGLLIADVFIYTAWLTQRVSFNTGKTIAAFRRNIRKMLSSEEACEEFAEDILEGARNASFREQGKNSMNWVAVGDRYWTVLRCGGMVHIVDANQVEKVETVTESGQIRVGKVRTSYIQHIAGIYFKNSARKKGCDYSLVFESEEALGFLVAQIRKHRNDTIEITAL